MAIFRKGKSAASNNDDWDIARQLADTEDMEDMSQEDYLRKLADTEDMEDMSQDDFWRKLSE